MQRKLKKKTSGQSVKLESTGRQNVNVPNHMWVKCTFPLN
jgi:hypothetical protein